MPAVAKRTGVNPRIRIGISSCLVGEAVRYDGSHRHNEYLTASLGRCFEYVPLCPEVAIGLGVPRPAIRLVRAGGAVRARGVKNAALDVTDRLLACADELAPRLAGLSGYILKKNSPSCGMTGVTLYSTRGRPDGTTRGVYAGRLMALHPELPFEEEGRLMDPARRENFIERVFVYHRWQRLAAGRLTPKSLAEFHTRHEYIVRAHDKEAARELGRLVAQAGKVGTRELGKRYVRSLMRALTKPATRARHAEVLRHIAGFFRQRLDAADRRELHEIIAAYRRGHLPLVAPITLLRHHLRRFPDPRLAGQHYLAPHPDELMLRDWV